MLRTARRRWTKDLATEVDGIAIGSPGPVLVHGYDPPAGGKWVDDVIPGKLGALSPSTGEILWVSPCEVGYGRGFGAGVSREDVVVLGPSMHGHRAVRMSLATGELIDARDIEAFDEALVEDDLCHLVAPARVAALSTALLADTWSYAHESERYHMIARDAGRLFVVYSLKATGQQGVITLDAATGERRGDFLEPRQTVIHAIAAGGGSVTVLVSDLLSALPDETIREYLIANPDADAPEGKLALVSRSSGALAGDAPTWFSALEADSDSEEFPDVTISHDSGRLYVVQGASLEVRDLATGGLLGEVTVPGLDEHVSWKVSKGAGVLAEETRLSLFEIPV